MKSSNFRIHNKTTLALLCSALMAPTAINAQSLEQAVAHALDSHPDIHIGFSNLQIRQQQELQAEAGYLPTVDVTGGYGYEYTNSPGIRRNQLGQDDPNEELKRGEFGISLRQSLFNGFHTTNEIARTDAETTAEQWRLFGTAEDLALQVTKVYLNLIKAQQVLTLSEKNLSSHQEIFEQIKQRTDSGLGSVADLSQITGRLARAQSNVITAKNNYRDSNAQFYRVINQQPADLVLPVPDADMLPATAEAGLKVAINNHPVIKSASADINAARFQHKATKSNYLPQVSFELDANYNNNLDGENGIDSFRDVGGHNNDITAMVRVSYNLFNGGRDKAAATETAYKITEATEINRNTHRQVTEGYTLAWNAFELLNKQKEYIKAHVTASKQTQSAYQQQFKLGQRSLLDLLDTENELFQARKDFINAEFSEVDAQYRVLNATGLLLDSLRVTRPAAWQVKNEVTK